jgi:N-succinyldiaminopimelate aminotransferase
MQGYSTTIFAEMSELAARTGAINLGQGFPDSDGPALVLDAAMAAIASGANQYPPGAGIPELRRAVADQRARHYGLAHDPETDVLVTAGATEGITAALLALCETGDEVIAFEPYYDSYAAATSLAGAVRVPLTLHPPDYRPDLDRLATLFGPRTRVLLVNSPHNPSGMVLRPDELAELARLCVRHDVVAVTDEVYEHLVFEGAHLPLATLPGMAERTLSVSSAGKTFSVTGWKIGWVCGPAPLVAAVRTVKQFLTYVSGGPFQPAVAAGLDCVDELVEPLRGRLRAGRDALSDGLAAAGFTVHPSHSTYFVTADAAPLGATDGRAFCHRLADEAGVVAIPTAVFYDHPEAGRTFVRFAFCKRPEIIAAAVNRLIAFGTSGASGPRAPGP